MKKIGFVIAVALSLGGCVTAGSVLTAAITQSQVDGARSAYDGGFLAGLHKYATLPTCTAGQTFLKNRCHNAGTLKTLRTYDRVVGNDFNIVQANLDAGNTSAISASWAVLQAAISTANDALNKAQAN